MSAPRAARIKLGTNMTNCYIIRLQKGYFHQKPVKILSTESIFVEIRLKFPEICITFSFTVNSLCILDVQTVVMGYNFIKRTVK